MSEGIPHALKLDLEEMQEAVFAEHGVTGREAEAAMDYYCNGAGRVRACEDAASKLRKKLGKHL
jgi:hypothetical protein